MNPYESPPIEDEAVPVRRSSAKLAAYFWLITAVGIMTSVRRMLVLVSAPPLATVLLMLMFSIQIVVLSAFAFVIGREYERLK